MGDETLMQFLGIHYQVVSSCQLFSLLKVWSGLTLQVSMPRPQYSGMLVHTCLSESPGDTLEVHLLHMHATYMLQDAQPTPNEASSIYQR